MGFLIDLPSNTNCGFGVSSNKIVMDVFFLLPTLLVYAMNLFSLYILLSDYTWGRVGDVLSVIAIVLSGLSCFIVSVYNVVLGLVMLFAVAFVVVIHLPLPWDYIQY